MTRYLGSAMLAISTMALAGASPALAVMPHAATSSHVLPVGTISGWNHSEPNEYNDRNYGQSQYNQSGPYRGPTWQGRDGRTYCRKPDGTTGLLIGGVVGGVVGHEIAGRGNRTVGTILGAAGGALIGRAIDRGNARCR